MTGRRTNRPDERGIALLATLLALTLLMLLALPFGVSMNAGADAAMREIEAARAAQAAASVRDLLLADAALSHPLFDESPGYDELAEWPDGVTVPESMKALLDEGRVTLGGEVEDLQRRIPLDSVSPLVLANLLGTAGRLAEPLDPEAAAMVLDHADALPDSGYVWVAHELIRYGQKDGNRLLDLERGVLREQGFAEPSATYDVEALVLDYRCVLAAAWPFLGRSGRPSVRVPYRATGELAEIANAGFGAFRQDELDVFESALEPASAAVDSATWGRPERVFDPLVAGESKTVRVKSALHLGPGSTVRLRDLASGAIEYGLVMSASSERVPRDLLLPSIFRLSLLLPVRQDFGGGDTVIEPLTPAPVNVNTAPRDVLLAMFANVRRATDVFVHDADGRQRNTPPRPFGFAEAAELADEILASRGDDSGAEGTGPYTGWRDFVDRLMRPRVEQAGTRAAKLRLLYFYRNLRTGRDSSVEMGTVPMTFTSGPWVRIRAAASLKRSRVAPGIAARHERVSLAAAVPSYRLEHAWRTQRDFEEAFVLDRRAPFWTTTPINLGAILPGDQGNDPAGRYFPHLLPIAFRDFGFGAPRYPANDAADAGVTPNPAIARLGGWPFRAFHASDSFGYEQDPRGYDVARRGAFLMNNVGPAGPGRSVSAAPRRHDGVRFPFTVSGGHMGPFSVQWWLEAQSLEGTTLLDYGDGNPDRNRFALHGRDGQLVLELLDAAGLDPDPSQSPAGIERTATSIELPLAELALPPNTPVHLDVSARNGRPDGIELQVDGMPRGRRKFVTRLTAAIPEFDPTLANNVGLPPQNGNERYFVMQVEDTDGFPPVGVLRVGTELFEYVAVDGNGFVCDWRDSIGGRGARQVAREHRPDIPLDSQGRPTVDIRDLQRQGINIDVFPSHPVGARVELYGYSTPLLPDSPLMPGETRLSGSIGGFAVARGYLRSGLRSIQLTMPGRSPIVIGEGIDENWTGDLELADPVVPQAPDRDYPPSEAVAEIAEAFPATGGYALLIQRRIQFQSNIPGTLSVSESSGGIEVIRFASREGSKLKGVERAQTLPGDDRRIPSTQFDGTARKFVMNWTDWPWDPAVPDVFWDNIPTMMLWVVPISLPVQNTRAVWDPQTTGLTEWVQLYPEGGDVNDTEWVRYDAIADNTHLVRGNRAAWNRLRFRLTQSNRVDRVQVGVLGPNGTPPGPSTPPWRQVTATSGYIGYIPRIEAQFPQIYWARHDLGFRGDMMLDFYQEGANRTSSHPHSNSLVLPCHRLDLSHWGNYSAFSGRPGRHDRVALVKGASSSGGQGAVEWHTVNWVSRRFGRDNRQNGNVPAELLGPWDFQLVAFTDGVRGQYIGPPSGQRNLEVRDVDRMVKFPSGELPAIYAETVSLGSGVGNTMPVAGFLDEVEVVQQGLQGLVVEEAFSASARTFRTHVNLSLLPQGPVWWTSSIAAGYPRDGGLVLIDGEIIAYQEFTDGSFTVATNGRGMLGTEIRDHDRGAEVQFLTNRPCAILSSGVGAQADVLPVKTLGAMPSRSGTVALGRELLHYTWVRRSGDRVTLEMPRWYPPGEFGTGTLARGLFRGRYGTTPQAGSAGEAVVQWPFRYWDRYAERSDDPELAYFQVTRTEAPGFYRSVRWRQEVPDGSVEVLCLARTDSRAPWDADPDERPDLWLFRGAADQAEPRRLGAQGSRIELRFATRYLPGAIDLVTMRAHGWKTRARVRDVVVEYEGESRLFDERVTLR